MSLLLALFVGCASGPYGAPDGAELTYMNDSDLGAIFDVSYNDPDDGIGLLMREQLMVTNEVLEGGGSRTMPLNNILVEVTSGWSAAYVIPSSVVVTVDDYETACDGDESDECNAWFDIGEERYVEFAGEYNDLGGLRPTYMSAGTDGRGLLDFYVFIDSIPLDDDGEVIPIPLFASIGVDTASWSYDFQ
ncbi:MAG: hypothetical protein Q8P18_12630 [Pseudomonadota bacterium]|nr:hypothetical protein [Pseudomonadota bacterium]